MELGGDVEPWKVRERGMAGRVFDVVAVQTASLPAASPGQFRRMPRSSCQPASRPACQLFQIRDILTHHLNASIGAFPCTPRHTTATACSGRAASAADLRRAEMHYCCGETCSPDARAVSAAFHRCGCCAGVERLLMDLWLNSCKGVDGLW